MFCLNPAACSTSDRLLNLVTAPERGLCFFPSPVGGWFFLLRFLFGIFRPQAAFACEAGRVVGSEFQSLLMRRLFCTFLTPETDSATSSAIRLSVRSRTIPFNVTS